MPKRIFDVQIAAGLVGYSYPLCLVNLVGQALRVSLAGSETRTDWRRRPLTPAQVATPLDDVRYLLELEDRLGAELARLGRTDWAEAEFAAFLTSIEDRADEQRWRRLPGLNQLNRRGLEAARKLSEWRESEARRQNRPMRQVMRDDLLVAIAKRQPAGRTRLEALRDFNRPNLISRSNEVLDIIREARGIPEEDLPEQAVRFEEPPGLSTVSNLLSAALAQCCAAERIAGSMVANVADLKHLVRWHLEGRPDDHRPSLLQGWRAEMCGRTLLDVLEGRVALRVANPGQRVPGRPRVGPLTVRSPPVVDVSLSARMAGLGSFVVFLEAGYAPSPARMAGLGSFVEFSTSAILLSFVHP